MKRITAACCTFILMSLCLVAGCTRTPTSRPRENTQATQGRGDPLNAAVTVLRHVETPGHFREALDLCNEHIKQASPPIQPSAEERALWTEQAGLSKSDVDFLTDVMFRPLDAIYLEGCYSLRDAARALEQPTATPARQARLAFDWTMRQVMLAEHQPTLLPSQFVLNRGQGNAWERALVFIELLRQFNIEGCIVTPAESSLLLVGVLVDGSAGDEILLFDVRASRPLLNDDGALQSLAEFRKSVKEVRVHAVAGLHALAPRMRYLQSRLAEREPIALAVDAPVLLKRLTAAAGQPVALWSNNQRPHGAPQATPMLAFRTQLPETGTDQAIRMLKVGLVPWPQITRVYGNLKLLTQLTPDASGRLMQVTQMTYDRFAVSPREFLVRGQYDRIHRRLEGIQSALNDLESAPIDFNAFVRRVSDWRNRINDGYLDLIRAQQAGDSPAASAAQANIDRLWSEDQYFAYLLNKDGVPKVADEGGGFREVILPKGVLTFVVLAATHEVLDQECNRLFAQMWQEKAEDAQATLDSLRDQKPSEAALNQARDKARSAWMNARGQWNRYVDRFYFFPAALQVRIGHIQDRLDRGDGRSALQWSQSLFDYISKGAQAKLLLARAELALGQRDAARSHLVSLVDELTKVQKNAAIDAALAKGAAETQAEAAAFRALATDLHAEGALHWLRAQAQHELHGLRD